MDGHRYLAKLAKALGHPVRLRILETLAAEGDFCVCHLEHRLGRRQAYISQHLTRLQQAGLVRDRREGLNIFYALADESVEKLLVAARQTTAALAGGSGHTLVFKDLEPAKADSCPCPRCQGRGAGI